MKVADAVGSVGLSVISFIVEQFQIFFQRGLKGMTLELPSSSFHPPKPEMKKAWKGLLQDRRVVQRVIEDGGDASSIERSLVKTRVKVFILVDAPGCVQSLNGFNVEDLAAVVQDDECFSAGNRSRAEMTLFMFMSPRCKILVSLK